MCTVAFRNNFPLAFVVVFGINSAIFVITACMKHYCFKFDEKVASLKSPNFSVSC